MIPYSDPVPRIVALLIDLLIAVAFAIIGRAIHGESLGLIQIAQTAWTFLLGVVAAWVFMAYLETRVTKVAAGILVWLSTWVIGNGLRWLTGAGVAVPFLIASAVGLAILFIGWRVIYNLRRTKANPA